MTQQISRLNLTGYNFPMLSRGIGSSIIVQSALDVQLDKVGGQQSNKPSPQLVYCENLLPTTEGYRSCIFSLVAPAAVAPASSAFGEVYNVAASDGALGWFAPAGGTNQLWKGTTWAGTGAFGAGLKTSHANITGQSYICYAYTALKRVDITVGTLTAMTVGSGTGNTIIGIDPVNIKGICASGNYLIAYAEQTISWSSPSNPMDFTPSLITGAGTATPSDLKGVITEVVQVADGFIIYTSSNAVSAAYSGNASYPWIFKHIAGSTGLRSSGDAVSDDISDTNIAWTLDGFQAIKASGVEPMLPEVTDFVAAKLLETYNATTGILTTTKLTNELNLSLHRLSARYLTISYGIAGFTHALIFDAALKRWGKIVHDHVEIISLPTNQLTSHRVICLVKADGSIYQLSNDATAVTAAGVAIIGRLTVTRTSKVTLQEVLIEGVDAAATMACRVGVSYDAGVTQQPLVTPVIATTVNTRKATMRLTGHAHHLHLTGMLDLTSLVITTTQDGKR